MKNEFSIGETVKITSNNKTGVITEIHDCTPPTTQSLFKTILYRVKTSKSGKGKVWSAHSLTRI